MKYEVTEKQLEKLKKVIQGFIDSALDSLRKMSEDWGLGEMDEYDEVRSVEKIVVDSGHMVAVQASVTMSLHKAATGWMNTIKSGEGLVFHFEGPGEVYTQTRNPNWFGRFASAGHSHGTN
jgi:hypothetical protein